jgi:hypothetical protein
MTRNGKIARLPREVREQLNRRLQDGEPGTKLVDWLNSVPEVHAVLAAEFEGRSISEQNLSEWKAGGYRDWLAQQETLDMISRLSADTVELKEASRDLLTDKLAVWLAARYVVVAQSLAASPDGDAADWKRLREFCSDLVALRKGDHSAERLELDREHLDLAGHDFELKRDGAMEVFFQQFGKEAQAHPEVSATVEALHEALLAAGFK